MTIEEKRRELFERFRAEMFGKTVTGPYPDVPSNAGWAAFNAALDAVVIDLPIPFTSLACRASAALRDKNDILAECRAAIESTGLGLKVKP